LGKSTDPGTEGEIRHEALGVVSFDPGAKTYRWRAYRAGSGELSTTVEISDKKFVWGVEIPQGGRIRFTIALTNKGEWFEVGERSMDGKAWSKFFEMTLRHK